MISATFSIRTGGMFQDANVAGRNYVTDDRWGGFISTKWTPTNDIKITTNYVHTDLSGLPDFGVPWYRQGNTPVTEVGIPRQNWYGFVNRDFQTARQDFGTLTGEYKVTDSITLTSRTRAEHSLLAYIGTLPNAPQTTLPNPGDWRFTASPQSRNQWVDILANQEEATFKFDTGSVKHTAVAGRSLQRAHRDRPLHWGFRRKRLAGFRSTATALWRTSRSMRRATRSFRSRPFRR